MIDLERRGSEWAVMQNGEVVSLHPTRAEAERAALWLRRSTPAESPRGADRTT